jgi:hypothetical protein
MKVMRETDGDLVAEHEAYRFAVRAIAECALQSAMACPGIERFLAIEDFQQVLVADLVLELLRALKRLDLPSRPHDA